MAKLSISPEVKIVHLKIYQILYKRLLCFEWQLAESHLDKDNNNWISRRPVQTSIGAKVQLPL